MAGNMKGYIIQGFGKLKRIKEVSSVRAEQLRQENKKVYDTHKEAKEELEK